MQIQGISHITFVVRDLEKMATFLCKGLSATEGYDNSAKSYSISREKFYMLGGVWLAAMEGERPAVRTYRVGPVLALATPGDGGAAGVRLLHS